MRAILIVGTGGFIGSVFRFLLSQTVQTKITNSFPWGTLAVNLIGCLLIGILFGLNEKNILTSETKLFLATGICGGFTTFSAFSVETFSMMKDGNIIQSVSYILLSVILGLLFTLTGAFLPKVV